MSKALPDNDNGTVERSVVGVAGTPGQGPHMVLVLKVLAGKITDARFSTYPCPAAHACGQWLTERVEGMSVEEASTIDAGTILSGAGNMPLGREHCPHLAADALAMALAAYSDQAETLPSAG